VCLCLRARAGSSRFSLYIYIYNIPREREFVTLVFVAYFFFVLFFFSKLQKIIAGKKKDLAGIGATPRRRR
jgi:hypothetical protein